MRRKKAMKAAFREGWIVLAKRKEHNLSGTTRTAPNAMSSDTKSPPRWPRNPGMPHILDATPFYAESGGQVGDGGTLTTHVGHTLTVEDTIK